MHDTVRLTWDGGSDDVVLPRWIEAALGDGDIQLTENRGTSTLQCNYIYAPDFFEIGASDIVYRDGQPVDWRLTRLDGCIDIELDVKPDFRTAAQYAVDVWQHTNGRITLAPRHYPPDGWMVSVGQRGSPRAFKIYLSSAKAGDGREQLWDLTGGRSVVRIEGEVSTRANPVEFVDRPLELLQTCLELLDGLPLPIEGVDDFVRQVLDGHQAHRIEYESAGPSFEQLILDASKLEGRALAMGVALADVETRGMLVQRSRRRTQARIRRAKTGKGRR